MSALVVSMVRPRRSLAAMLGAAAVILLANPGTGAAAELRQCQVASGTQYRLTVSYATARRAQDTVQQFDAELELNPSAGYREGQVVQFLVRGIMVGRRKLEIDRNGDLDADLKLSTEFKKGPRAWPDDFPRVVDGTSVVARIGGRQIATCKL